MSLSSFTLGNFSIETLLGQTDGSFSQVSTPLSNPTFSLGALGDLNHDGKLDLLAFEFQMLRVWLGNGDGTFTKSIQLGSPQNQFFEGQAISIADLDGDGNTDVVVLPDSNPAAPAGPITIFYGNGEGTFQDPVFLPISHRYSQLVIADVNRDNKPDFVLSDGSVVAVMANLGGRNFDAEAHYVAGQGISGLSVADVNGDGFPDIIIGNAGGTTVTVLLNQPNGNPEEGAWSQGDFTVSPEPAKYSQSVTLSISMAVPSGPVPSGSVSFSVDGSFIATNPLVNGKTTYSYATVLETGFHTFVATYNGDKTYRQESFAVWHQVLPPVYPTQTSLTAVPKTVYTSQTVHLTAAVVSTPPVPGGFVTFMDGTSSIGAELVDQNGVAVFDTAMLTAGKRSLTAVYQGFRETYGHQSIFQPSTSSPFNVTVNSIPTITSLSASSNSITVGTVVTFTSGVTSGLGVPFGSVTFFDGTVALGTSSLQADAGCSFSTASLAVGTHNIAATFNANGTFASSTSSVVVVTVTPAAADLAPAVVALSATQSGDQSVLVAMIGTASSLAGGGVVFLDNGAIVGSVTAGPNGSATLNLPALGSGVHNLSASFAGTTQFAASVSPVLVEQWPASGPGFSSNVTANSIELTKAGSQPILVTIVPTAGFTRQVQLSCRDGLPQGYECVFSPASLYEGNSYLRIQPFSGRYDRRAGSSRPYGTAIGVFSILLIGVRRRQTARWIILAAALLGLALMGGCCNQSASVQQQMTVLSIQATAGTASNMITHSAQMVVMVRN